MSPSNYLFVRNVSKLFASLDYARYQINNWYNIIEEKKRGKTILLSSHIFSEVDATCDRIAIIKDGKILDPKYGGKGSAQFAKHYKKNSENFVHITGYHDNHRKYLKELGKQKESFSEEQVAEYEMLEYALYSKIHFVPEETIPLQNRLVMLPKMEKTAHSVFLIGDDFSALDIWDRKTALGFANPVFIQNKSVEEAVKHFDEGNFEGFLEQFFKAIHSRYDIERPIAKRFIRRKLGIINQLKDENRQLKEKMHEQQKMMEKYAKEYYQMGNDCITQAHDARSAIANYEKAIAFYPKYLDAWVRKGITLYNEQDYYEAEVCLNEAVRLRPGSFKAIYNRGKIRLALENIDGALGDLDRAISLKPEHPKAHELFGEVLMRMGKEEEAAIHWALAERLREKKKKE